MVILMDDIIKKYFNYNNSTWIFLEETIIGIILIIILFYSQSMIHTNMYVSYLFTLFATSFLINLLTKLIVLKLLYKVIVPVYSVYEINNIYSKTVTDDNKLYIKKNILKRSKGQRESLIYYLNSTQEDLEKIGGKDAIMMMISFIVGAGFTDGGKFNFIGMENAITHVFSLFIAGSIFYFVIIKIIHNYKKLKNYNYVKKELLINILEILYEK